MGSSAIGSTLFGKARRAVLSLTYGHPDESFHLRRIARFAGVGMGVVQRELKELVEAGILRRTVSGRQVYYQAESSCPVFQELRGLVLKTAGVADVLREALVPLGDRIAVAFVYGSVARGSEQRGSDVDVMIVGDVSFLDCVDLLGPAQERLGREINPTVFPHGEFLEKLRSHQHFLESVLAAPKTFLVGSERDLARLAQERLADGTRQQP